MTLTVVSPEVHGPTPPAVSDVVEALAAGCGRLVVVEGGPGAGRSTVLRQAVSRARQRGLAVASARCSEAERAEVEAVARQLGLRERGSGPVLLAVDDVHWCDVASLHGLAHLARRIDERPVLLVVTVDPAEWSGVDAALADLVHAPWRERWRLGPLGPDDVAARCAAVLGTGADELAHACAEVTGGGPGLLNELLLALQAGRRTDPADPAVVAAAARRAAVPEVGTAALRRADRHSAAAGRALRALSVVSAPLPPALLPSLLELEPAAADAAADVLCRLSYATVTGAGIVIDPPLLRRSVRQVLGAAEWHRVQARAARVFARRPETLEVAAAHLLAAPPEGQQDNVLILRSCAAQMQQAGRFEDAVRTLRRALDEPPAAGCREAVLGELGAAELYDQPAAAVEHLREAVAGTADDEARLRNTLRLAHGLAVLGRGVEAQQHVHDELGRSALRGGHELRRRAAAELLFIGLSSDEVMRARRRSGVGVSLPARVERLSTSIRILDAAFAAQPAAELVDGIRQGLTGGLEPTDESGMGWLVIASVLLWADELAMAGPVLDSAAAEARRWNAPLPLATALWLNGLVAVHAGQLERAGELVAEAGDVARGQSWSGWDFGPSIAAAALEQACGAGPAAGPVPVAGAELPRQWAADMALTARGRLRLARGDVEGGLAELMESGRRLTAIGCVNPAMADWRSAAAVALHRLGRDDEATPLVEEEVALAGAWGAPRVLGVALRRRGRVRGGAEGIADAAAGLDVLGPGFPLERARMLRVLGRLHRAARDIDAARAALGEAHDVAEACGAERLLGLVREDLLVVGGRPRVARPGRRVVMTSGEEPVARMAARGASNVEIAGELYLARRTVEAHLTSVYRKLGIRGRSQLPDALRGLDAAEAPTG